MDAVDKIAMFIDGASIEDIEKLEKKAKGKRKSQYLKKTLEELR